MCIRTLKSISALQGQALALQGCTQAGIYLGIQVQLAPTARSLPRKQPCFRAYKSPEPEATNQPCSKSPRRRQEEWEPGICHLPLTPRASAFTHPVTGQAFDKAESGFRLEREEANKGAAPGRRHVLAGSSRFRAPVQLQKNTSPRPAEAANHLGWFNIQP